MKPFNQQELRTFVKEAELFFKGYQLQEVLTNDQGLALGFYREQMHWLVFDFKPAVPMILFFKEPVPFRKSLKAKPVGLFIKSHGKNKTFRKIEVLEQWGRVISIELESRDEHCLIEAHLIPKQMNLLVTADGKTVSWEKPRPLKEASIDVEREQRSIEEIRKEWIADTRKATNHGEDPKAQWEKQRQKNLDKKRKAAEEIQKKLNENQGQSLRRVGEALKAGGFSGVEAEDRKLLALEKSLSWNIEDIFRRAKLVEQKQSGTQERLHILETEIAALETAQYRPAAAKEPLDDLMRKTEARGRKLNLESGAVAYIGKSAADNLALLRQAKSWDYWLHLKDYPGAHALVHRQKNQEISREDLIKVAKWVASESLSAKALSLGQKLAVVFVECRFVKPIKGDKMGRVTYHSEKNLMVAFDSQK